VKSFRERSPGIVGIISILAIAAGLALAFSIPDMTALRGVYTLSADLEDAAGVQPGNEIRVAGVRVGRVTGVQLRPGAARIEMEIESDIQIPERSRAEVKLKTLLGQKFIEIKFPRTYLAAASEGKDPTAASGDFYSDGDVIPKSSTDVPFEIYQAATEGTETLEKIDKAALRDLIDVLGETVGATKDELSRALGSIEQVGEVLDDKGPEISTLLTNLEDVSGTLATKDEELDKLLVRGADVLKLLADQRQEISSLVAATSDLGNNLGLLIQAARGNVELGVNDLNDILLLVEGEIDTIGVALDELPVAQEMFAVPADFGRFIEGTVCAVTSEDTCTPIGSPDEPGLPIVGQQPGTSP
jgi:phospholipid/cholesterol/gamma-HCH transport system substrate-binding protein